MRTTITPPEGYVSPYRWAMGKGINNARVYEWIAAGRIPYVKYRNCFFIPIDAQVPSPLPARHERSPYKKPRMERPASMDFDMKKFQELFFR